VDRVDLQRFQRGPRPACPRLILRDRRAVRLQAMADPGDGRFATTVDAWRRQARPRG